jgi:hypothetical protein
MDESFPPPVARSDGRWRRKFYAANDHVLACSESSSAVAVGANYRKWENKRKIDAQRPENES